MTSSRPWRPRRTRLTLQQCVAKLEQLQATFQLRREAAAADLRILEIRRERAARALRYAEENATKMQVRAPFAGLVVVKTTYKPGTQGQVEILEGDGVWPGIADHRPGRYVGHAGARPSQPGRRRRSCGPAWPATIRLDGFPELSFKGRIEQVTPLAITGMSQTVRLFVAVVSIEGSHPQLLPDLTASVEVAPAPAFVRLQPRKGGQ